MGEAKELTRLNIPITGHSDPMNALEVAMKAAKPDDLVLATGSFYLCGELRKRWYPEEWILKNRKSFLLVE